ncbi:hypothetical protein BDU57DRAFT_553987 [Ampelomyces quisqualis]|uniref:BTB domain-containing protein n=1 Tax=Ampelomyces quisqualis TaxID=50730 RepID=A0A6A5R1S5_AMPQU|nr:hypothetical protein BDU57DRAFT_553987 [Ampelomyces quisqualis]
MAPDTHIIDPDADTIITLKGASNVFAPWDEIELGLSQKDKESGPFEITSPESSPSEISEANSVARRRSELTIESEELEDQGIQYHVSSRHLKLASPWFRRALSEGKWSESGRKTEDGLFHVTATDWDAEAFLMLLNIIHSRHKQVPRILTLEMLAKIAVLIDYYECGETVELYTSMWIDHVTTSVTMPKIYYMKEFFQRATVVAITSSDEALRTLGLPIPSCVSAELDLKRCQAIESVIAQLHDLLEGYRNKDYTCPLSANESFQCGAFLLGVLTKEMDAKGLLSPRPELPFAKLSLHDLHETIRTIKSPSWASKINNSGSYHVQYMQHKCNLNSPVTWISNNAMVGIHGLDLACAKKGNFI